MLPAPAPPLHSLAALHLSPSPFSTTNRRPRTRVSKACSHCQKSHLSCDHGRPCARCIKKGTSATCVDGLQKKRGKKPRQWYLDQGLEPPARVTRKPSVKRQLAAASKTSHLGSLAHAQVAQSRLATHGMILSNGAMFYPAPYLYSPFMPPPDIPNRQMGTPFLMGSAPPFLQSTPSTPTESPYNSPENTDDESVVGKKLLSQDERGAADILSAFTRNPQSPSPGTQLPNRVMSSPYLVPPGSMAMMRPPLPGMQYPSNYPPLQVNMYNPSASGFAPLPPPSNLGYPASAMANPQMYGIPTQNS